LSFEAAHKTTDGSTNSATCGSPYFAPYAPANFETDKETLFDAFVTAYRITDKKTECASFCKALEAAV